jgi:hypothetical protein
MDYTLCVSRRTDPGTSAFAQRRHAVGREWTAEQSRVAKERFYDSIRRKYLVMLDGRVAE